MLFGKKAAAPKKVAKKAPKKVAKKAAPPSSRKFFTNDKATKSYGVETPAISLYNLFGGAAAPRDRDLENLANPYGKLGRALKPEEYDTRTKTKPFQKGAKKFTKSGTINRRDASTW